MPKTYLIFIISFIFINKIEGQNIIFSNIPNNYINYNTGIVTITLSTDLLSVDFECEEKLTITSTQNVTMSGYFDSSSTTIKPQENYSIKIIPNPTNQIGRGVLTGGNGTVVAGGRRETTGGTGTQPGTGISTIIYPIPATTYLNFSLTNTTAIAYSIINQNGTIISNQAINPPTNNTSIDVSTLPSGTYFLQLNIGNSNYLTIKFYKQ